MTGDKRVENNLVKLSVVLYQQEDTDKRKVVGKDISHINPHAAAITCTVAFKDFYTQERSCNNINQKDC
ncbi:MAG: hypothetical protein ACI4KR_13835 [Ruminiclostridium sp.]